MKRILSIAFALLVVASACKKIQQEHGGATNLYMFHGAADAGKFRLNPGAEDAFVYQWFSGYPFNSKYQMNPGEYKRFVMQPGSRVITAVKATDTLVTLFSGKFDFSKAVNTLYVIGDTPNLEAVFVSGDNIPYIDKVATLDGEPLDSSIYIRFINMSPDDRAVKVVFKDSTEQANGLTYKKISDFKKYPALYNTKPFKLEARDAVTNDSLSIITINPTDAANGRFNSISVILMGRKGMPGFQLRQMGYFDAYY